MLVAILSSFDNETRFVADSVVSHDFAMTIRRGCDAIEPLAFYISAIIVYPTTVGIKLKGVLLGIIVLPFLNLIRLASLFYSGGISEELFEILHIDIWQPLFIVCTSLMWFLWWRITSMSFTNKEKDESSRIS